MNLVIFISVAVLEWTLARVHRLTASFELWLCGLFTLVNFASEKILPVTILALSLPNRSVDTHIFSILFFYTDILYDGNVVGIWRNR